MKPESRTDAFFNTLLIIVLSFLLFFTAASFGGVKTVSFYFSHLITLIFVFIWLLRMLCTRKIRLFKSFAYIPVILFAVYAIGYYFFTDIPFYARQDILKVIDYGLIFLVIVNSFQRQKYQYALAFILIIGALVLASVGSIQYFKHIDTVEGIGLRSQMKLVDETTGQPMTIEQVSEDAYTVFGQVTEEKPEQYQNRASGTFVCPNHLAGFLEMVFPIALALCLFSRLVMGARLFIGYASVVVIFGWVLTFSRGGWLAGAAGLIALFIAALFRDDTRNKNWLIPFVVIVIVLSMAALFIKPIKERVLTIRPGADSSIATRVTIWKQTIPMIEQQPVFGYGPASFAWRYPPFRDDTMRNKVTYTHNDYLNLLVDYGAVGFVIVALFFIFLLSRITRIPQLYDHPNNQALLIGSLAALATILVHAVFDFNNHIHSNGMLMVIIAALVVLASTPFEFFSDASWRFSWINRNLFLLLAVGFGITLCLAGGFVHGYRLLKSDILYREGVVLQNNILWEQALQRYGRARKYDPVNPHIYEKMAEIYSAKAMFRRDNLQENTAKAVELYDTALAYNPYESDYMFKKALLLKRLGRNEAALESFRRAAAQEPTNKAYKKQLEKMGQAPTP